MNKRLVILGTIGSAVLLLGTGCAHHGGPHGHHGGMKKAMHQSATMPAMPMDAEMNAPLNMSVALPEPDNLTSPPVSAGFGPHTPPAASAGAEGSSSPSALSAHHEGDHHV